MGHRLELEELSDKYNRSLQYLLALSREVLSLNECHSPTGHRIRHDNAEGLARRSIRAFRDEAERLGFTEGVTDGELEDRGN